MVGSLAKLCVCALVVVVASPPGAAQIQRAADNRPASLQEAENAINTITRTINARPQPQEANETRTWGFATGLEDSFDGTYAFTRAIEYAEQMGEQASSRESVTENVSMQLRVQAGPPRPDGISVVNATVMRYRARVESPDGPVSVDFDLSRELPDDADGFTGLDAMLPALKNAEIQVLVDTNGNVNAIDGLPDVAAVLAEDAGGAALFSVLDETQFAVLFSKLFNAEGGVERAKTLPAGEDSTWSTVEEVPMGPSGDLIITRSWTPRALPSGEIEARGVFAASIDNAPAGQDGATPSCNVGSYSGVSRILWQQDGGLGYLNATEAIALEWTLGVETLRTVQQTVTTINRLEE
ncbi:MAG: hypothetical protein AAGH64_05670 [Planctomycetota bacterium]